MTWPDDCPNISILNFNGVACCFPCRGMYLGACLAARNGGCYTDFGEWGVWRSVLWIIGDASTIQKAAEICPWTDVQKIKALDIAGTIARVALDAVGWSP